MDKPESSFGGNQPQEPVPPAQGELSSPAQQSLPPSADVPSASPKRNPAALFFVAAIVAALLFAGFHAARPTSGGPDALDPTGKPAPDFTLQTLDGKNVTLSSLRGKGVL